MTVDEVRKAKTEAEEAVFLALKNLEEKTTCHVDSVYAQHIQRLGEFPQVIAVTINLKLES